MKLITNVSNNIKFIVGGILVNKMFYFIILIMTILGLLLSSVFFPFTFSSTFDYFIMVTVPLFLILGGFTFSVRNSNLYSGMETSGHTKAEFYLGQLASTGIMGTILTIGFLFAFEIFARCGLILSTYSVDPNADKIPAIETLMFNNYYGIPNLVYVYNLNILVTFSIYFLVHNIIKDQKQYYVFVMIIMLLTFVYGALLNEYFDSAKNFGEDKGYPDYHSNLFPDSMFIPSLLFPYFSIHSMLSYGFTLTALEYRSNIADHGNTFGNLSGEYNRQGIEVFVMPYVGILVGLIVGLLTSRIKEK